MKKGWRPRRWMAIQPQRKCWRLCALRGRADGARFGFEVLESVFFLVSGIGHRVSGFGFRASGFELRVEG